MTAFTGDFSIDAAIIGLPAAHDTAGASQAEPKDADDLRLYLRHVEGGETIRALAREAGCHASTILRRIRRIEARRDDPLIDQALERAGGTRDASGAQYETAQFRRVLRRLAESGAVMVLAEGMEKAIVVRGDIRTAILDRRIAEKIALNGWVILQTKGKVARYAISATGRGALKTLVAERKGGGLPQGGDFSTATPVGEFAEATTPFDHADQHRVWAEATIIDPEDGRRRRTRVNIAESPLQMLARRREADGSAFLTPALVAAGERLREDFELSQLGPRTTQNWDGFLTSGCHSGRHGASIGGGSEGARNRVAAALRELGPGMGDLCLRVCCFLEGIEITERRLGWSARSGKIVLRLALMRLETHYATVYGPGAPLIG